MATVHSYARFSSPQQAWGDSERRQAENGAAWVKRHGHVFSTLAFFDPGKSGFRGAKQKALGEFLKAIAKGIVKPGDILLCEAIDRLSRRGIRPTQDLVNGILNAGVSIAILTPVEKIYRAEDTNSIGDAIELAAFAYQANTYSANLSYRIKNHFDNARVQARANGKSLSGQLPAWLDTKDKPNAHSVAIIHHIFKRVIDGIGAHCLVAELEAKGYRSFTKSGMWNNTYIRKLIRNRAVLGEYQPHENLPNGKRQPVGEPIVGYYPAIIDERVWIAANAAIDNRVSERGPRGKFCNLFTGMITYGTDGCPAHIFACKNKQGKTMRRLMSWYAKCNKPGANKATIQLDHFEAAFLSYLKEVVLPADTTNPAVAELTVANAKLAKAKKRIAEIQKLVELGDDDLTALIAPLKALQLERKALEQSVRVLSAQANQDTGGGLESVKRLADLDLADNATRQELRESIKQAVETITIYPAKLGSQRRSPVACVVDIAFRNGTRRIMLQCGKRVKNLENVGYVKPGLLTDKANGRFFSPSLPEFLGKHFA